MSLRKKIFLSLGLLWLTLIVLSYGITRYTFMERFNDLEVARIRENAERVLNLVESEKEDLRIKLTTWSYWDDTYQFIQNLNRAYVRSNLTDASLLDFDLSFLLFIDRKGKIIESRAFDLEKSKRIPLAPHIASYFKEHPHLWNFSNVTGKVTGLMALPDSGNYLFASLPILTSEKKGPIHGTLIFGRKLDQHRFKTFSDRIKIPMSLKGHENLGAAVADAWKDQPEYGLRLNLSRMDYAVAELSLSEITNAQKPLKVEIYLDRAFYRQNLSSLNFILSILMVIGAVMGLFSVLLVERLFLGPLGQMSRAIARVGRIPDGATRKDELGQLGQVINSTAEKMEQAFQSLEDKYFETQKLNRQLERAHRQMLQSQKYETVSRLASGFGHEFNHLISIVKGAGELMERDLKNDADQLKRLMMIRKAADQATDQLKKLLMFARQAPTTRQQINARDLLINVQQLLTSSFGTTLRVRLQAAQNLWRFEADENEITQALVQIAVKSKDTMPTEGELNIEIENVSADESFCRSQLGLTPGNYVRIRLSDTGMGLAKEEQGRLFDPMASLDALPESADLSLSSAYNLIRRHQGVITLYSEKGLGTVFNVYFPRVEKAVDIVLSPLTFDESRLSRQESFNGRLMILADDDYLLRELSRDLLESEGAVVLTAESGQEAYDLYCQHQRNVSLIMSDVVMPNLSGIDLALKLRAEGAQVPILLVSGYNDHHELPELLRGPDLLFLTKPYRRIDLLELVWSLILAKESKDSSELKADSTR